MEAINVLPLATSRDQGDLGDSEESRRNQRELSRSRDRDREVQDERERERERERDVSQNSRVSLGSASTSTASATASASVSTDSASVASSSVSAATTAGGSLPVIACDNVYLNGLHHLQWVYLRNPSQTHRVQVRLKTTLGPQLAFQLTNENLPRPRLLAPTSASARRRSAQMRLAQSSVASTTSTATATSTSTSASSSVSGSASASTTPNHFSDASLSMPLPPAFFAPAPGDAFDDFDDDEDELFEDDQLVGNSEDDDDDLLDTPTPFKKDNLKKLDQHLLQQHPEMDDLPLPLNQHNVLWSPNPADFPTSPLNLNDHTQLALRSPTSAASAAAPQLPSEKNSNNHDHQYNQLFNYVNYIDQVDLEPGQTLPVVLAFLPDDQSLPGNMQQHRSSSPDQSHLPGSSLDSTSLSLQSPESTPIHNSMDNGEELHDFCEINGLIFFFAFIIKPTVPDTHLITNGSSNGNGNGSNGSPNTVTTDQRTSSMNGGVPLPSHLSSNTALVPSEIVGEDGVGNFGAMATTLTRDSGSPDYQVTLKFRSRVCRSVLWTDIGETGISFDGCVVGSTYFKDFSIWNKSEIDLYWVLNTIDLSNRQNNSWLTFSDYDTAEPLDFTRPIPSYSQRRIRVTFKPTEPGEFNYDLQLENCNDSAGNTVQALVTADVKSAPTEELLRVENSMVDFGDCYTGALYKQRITVRNLSDAPVDLFLGVEENVDLVFQLIPSVEYPFHHIHSRGAGGGGDDGGASGDELRRLSGSTSSRRLFGEDGVGGGGRPVLRTGRIRELAGLESASLSDLSNPSSSLNSRSSSPVTLQRLNSETLTSSSMDLLDLMGRRGTATGAGLADDGSSYGGDVDDLGIYGSSVGTMNSEQRRFTKDGDEVTRIEELSLRPGIERTIELCYRPTKDPVSDTLHTSSASGGRLIKRNFRVTLTYMKQGSNEKERKNVQCKAKTCTSLIEVVPKELNFGDTDVGTLKSLPITVLNLSELTAKVEVQFVSKVLSCYRGELLIPPKQSIEIKLDIYPRKVNPDYCKQITVVNFNNRENDQIVEVKSTHIDKNRVTFHSLFYRILTPGSTNFMDFGSVILNAPTVRSFSIENTSKKKLVLEITSSMADEIVIYSKRANSRVSENVPGTGANIDSMALKEQLIDTLGDKKPGKRLPSDSTPGTAGVDDALSPATAATAPRIHEVTSSIIAQNSFEATDTNDAREPKYLDLASLRLSGKEAKFSPNRKITTAMMASSSEGLQQLRKQYRDGHGFSNEEDAKESAASPQEGTVTEPSAVSGGNGNGNGDSKPRNSLLAPNGAQLPKSNARPAQRPNNGKPDPAPPAAAPGPKLNLDAFLKSLEEFTGAVPPLFSKQISEEKYVKAYQLLQRELTSLIKDGRLCPITVIELEPGSETSLVAVMTASGSKRPFVQTKAKKHDAKILIKIVDFDRDIHQPQFEQLLSGDIGQIPVRELMLRCSLCRSMMELGQRNINFGYLDKNEPQTKTIVIRNKSEAPLFYYVRKSGSISSGDITIPDARIGLIRGYGKKEIDFIFDPSLAGQFQEKLSIENIHDRENDQTLTIKAHIRQPSKFSIDNLELDFGPCLLGEFSGNIQHIVVSNTSSKTRTFEVRIDDEKLDFRTVVLDVRLEALGGAGEGPNTADDASGKKKPVLSKEIMEKIEELEQKLKIYRRKGKEEKIKKALDKLEKLRSGNMEDDIGKSKDENSSKIGSEFESISTSDSVSVAPRNDKAKYTAGPLSIVIEPKGSKTVAVHIRPMRKLNMLPNQVIQEVEICHGSVFVHESKNTDVMKNVTFRCVACFEQKRFTELLIAEGHNMALIAQNPINEQILIESETVLANESRQTVLSPIDTMKPLFTLELTVIDIGRLEINEKRDCYFTMFNQTDSKLQFEIIPGATNSLVVFKEPIGSLEPRESRRIYLQITPVELGRQQHSFKVASLDTVENVTFTFYGILNAYLQFPCLTTPTSQLELGPCYVNSTKKFAKVQPFDVVNISDCEISISASSNLSQQCIIFAEKTLEIPANEVIMKPRERLTLYIALQPSVLKPSNSNFQGNGKVSSKSVTNLNAPSGSMTSETALTSLTVDKPQVEVSRTLIGGIKFSVNVLESVELDAASPGISSFYVLMQSVRFTAVIGVSNLALEECYVDLGNSKSIGATYSGQITVLNRSPRLPLVFTVECQSPEIQLEKYSGVIAALEDDSSSAISNSLTSLVIPFTFKCSKWGHTLEQIVVKNENNPSQDVSVEVRFFADIGFTEVNGLALYCPAKIIYSQHSMYSKSRFEAKVTDDRLCPVIWWDDIYVAISSAEFTSEGTPMIYLQKKARTEVEFSYEKSFELVNKTEELLEIAANVTLNNGIRWVRSGGSGFVMSSNSDLSQTGNLLLQKHQKASVYVSVHLPPATEEVCRRLLAGKNVTVRGLLLLENPEKDVALNAIDLIASYGLSVGSVEPTFIDLGRVGHLNNWEDVPFSFSVLNQSECSLQYEIELPDMIEIVKITNELGQTMENSRIENCKQHIVEAVLKPRKIANDKVGPCISAIKITNLFNPRNVLTVEARSVLTLLDLKFERLVDGELVLPPLVYPGAINAAPCDNWFKIINKSEQDLKFEIEFEALPELSDFVHLDIVSRQANSHLNGILTLEPLGALDVRIRAYVQDGARLMSNSEKSKTLTSPYGVMMGSLLITTKYHSASADSQGGTMTTAPKRMTQNIPLRCTVVEGPTFGVSEKRIKFTCFPIDSIESATHQMKQISLTNHSRFFPLNFRVAIDYPLEFPLGTNLIEISPLGSENDGTVEPGSQLILSVTLLKSNIGGISDSVKLHIYDINSVNSFFQTVQISITESTMTYNTLEALSVARHVDSERNDSISESMEAITDNVLSEHELSFTEEPQSIDDEVSMSDNTSFPNSNLSGAAEKIYTQYSQSNRSNMSDHIGRRPNGYLLNLRGCKRILDGSQQSSEPGGLFELDLGQQDISSAIVTKRIVLESQSTDRVSYKIRTLSDNDKSWILLSRSDGTLDARNTSHSINFNFVTSVRGMYSTYIIIDNLDNPLDSKIIRTYMAVVGKHNLRRTISPSQGATTPSGILAQSVSDSNNVFDVIVAGLDPLANEGLSNDVITMNGLYYDMEYTARSIIIQNHESVPLEFFIKSNLKSNDPTELIFSLSRSAAKVFRSVIVQPESFMRVFLRYRPSLGDDESAERLDLATGNKIDQKVVEISVNCRLVKDYQKTIYLRASCRCPQIYLPTQEVSFSGKIRRKAPVPVAERASAAEEEKDTWEIKFAEPFSSLRIENLLSDALDFEVLNDSMYFGVDIVADAEAARSTPIPVGKKPNCSSMVDVDQSRIIRVYPIMNSLQKDIDVLRREKYFVEQITIYNKKRPSEKYWIVLKLSFGHLNHFQVATGSRHSYIVLEGQIIRLLREIHANDSVFNVLVDVSTEANVGNEKAAEIYFRYMHIVEDLIYFGTREQATDYLQLAGLLFCGVLKRPIFMDLAPSSLWSSNHRRWPEALAKWISLFLYLLSFFPHSSPSVESLRELSRSLVAGAPSIILPEQQ
ncbi:hypothetical protein BCR33DRAFT_713934 [Rhizoclosmatium globosum]|uniref:MSP domain-containing protein n=1 Tax=Rhizoclosmatium globosum TaxID=329046 RepID=A0A1Y2CRF1_9FUNG|nr:hypothetical protein BCR33DRAFT_713934 [Rhizoclosmatium globosum]|eukprot:ORY49611.1 hypothetical protein BCR33DRAFT_713934 [Rhizoclosmatium globosum]